MASGGVIDGALFVTGTLRSGTTLLQRLLDTQDGLSVLSQPFPLLFVEAKRAFLRMLGAGGERYPLGHLFLESRYQPDSLDAFLRRWRTTGAQLEALFAAMRDYSGQRTHFTPEQLLAAFAGIAEGDDFAAVVARLDRLLGAKPEATCFGSKETFCEEFVPFLLGRGFRCAIIIRDPRDVVASLNHGRGREFGGERRPTLFNVRSWRKSVAVALAMDGRPGFHWCRYEDLVRQPAAALSRLATALGIGDIDASRFDEGLRADGWSGNSSFGARDGITTESLGIHRGVLPVGVADHIEATCLPEMRLLGYDTSMTVDLALEVIARFRDPYQERTDGMERDVATPENAAIEAERLQRLLAPPASDAGPWFLFTPVEAALRDALATASPGHPRRMRPEG